LASFNVTLSIGTNNDCPSPQDAVRYFIEAVRAGGIRYTVENAQTGETVEVDL
jgi:hypothetical protein